MCVLLNSLTLGNKVVRRDNVSSVNTDKEAGEHTIHHICQLSQSARSAKETHPVSHSSLPNAVYPCSTCRAIASRIFAAGALPHAVLESCHRPTQRRGGLNGPRGKVSQ